MELILKIESNEKRLGALKQKRENIDREIVNLEVKIQNQKFALKNNTKKES